MEGAVRVVTGTGHWSEDREEEGEVSGPQVMRGTLHCAVTNIAADGIMSTVDTISSHTTPLDSRHHVPSVCLELTLRAMGPDHGTILLSIHTFIQFKGLLFRGF